MPSLCSTSEGSPWARRTGGDASATRGVRLSTSSSAVAGETKAKPINIAKAKVEPKARMVRSLFFMIGKKACATPTVDTPLTGDSVKGFAKQSRRRGLFCLPAATMPARQVSRRRADISDEKLLAVVQDANDEQPLIRH